MAFWRFQQATAKPLTGSIADSSNKQTDVVSNTQREMHFSLIYYIHTEIYSLESYVISLHTQMSSSQSEERKTFFHTWQKKQYNNYT